MDQRNFFLIKVFGEEKYADAFIQKGELFCRTLGGCKEIEGDNARSDPYEGVTDYLQPNNTSVTIKIAGIECQIPSVDLGVVIMQKVEYESLNLYCMSAMFEESTILIEELSKFGEFAVVVYQVKNFIRLIRKRAEEKNLICYNRLVEYYSTENFHGGFADAEAVFRKRDIYKDESEYRFAFGSKEPKRDKIIHLGPLDKIAFKIARQDINQRSIHRYIDVELAVLAKSAGNKRIEEA